MRCALIATTTSLLALLAATPAAAGEETRPLPIEVVSNRADLISGGEALVSVRPRPRGVNHERIRVTLNGEDVTDAFDLRANGRFEGLVTGLALGRNVIKARIRPANAGESVAPVARRRGKAVITNHPNGGPVFSGPQVGPWTCQATAVDEQCNQDPTYEFRYRNTNGQLQPYDPENPPADVATTTTDQGVTVPFIIRIETGYQDRDQYKIATLYQPDEPWAPWAPQEQWNHKVLVTHGASCGVTYRSGEAPSVTADGLGGVVPDQLAPSSPTTALGRGFAVMSTALDNAGHNCNIATQAESLVMAKERIVEQYGRIRYTIGTGCSGGSLTQQQVANAYPGIYQGILPQCSYPDALSTGAQFADYHLMRLYFEDVLARLPQLWLPIQWGPVEGHLSGVNAVVADEAFFKTATAPGGDCVAPDVVYHPQNNPGGVRCSILDYMINVFGPRPEADWSPMEQAAGRGFGAFPVGNVGIQYGLGALESGLITTEQFVDLNAEIGGLDIDINPVPERIAGDEQALANTYRSGAINQANNMDRVAIIDLRGPDPAIAHDAYRSWEMRARIEREHGDHDNHVIWFGLTPLLGDLNFPTEALLAMDEWLSAVEADSSDASLAEKIAANKPSDLHDECEPTGLIVDANCELVTGPHRYGTPRTVAGDAITTDNNACQLKPLDRGAYELDLALPITFTDAQWARMQAAFPTGVCDYSKPGIGQQDTIAWQTYQEANGDVIYGGRPMGAAPEGSGTGWTSRSFSSWLAAETG